MSAYAEMIGETAIQREVNVTRSIIASQQRSGKFEKIAAEGVNAFFRVRSAYFVKHVT